MLPSRVTRCGINGRGSRECAVEVILRCLEEGGRCPEQSPCIRRRLNRGRIVSRKEARLDLSDPIPVFRDHERAIAGQMTLELYFVKAFLVEGAESRRHSPQRTDESALRRDNSDDHTESDTSRELETSLSFTLHLGQRVSSREKICVQVVAAECGIDEITDPAGGVETASLELSPCLDVSRPWRDKSPKIHIGAGLIAMQSTVLHQVVTKLAKPESGPIVSETRSSDLAEEYIGEARCVAVAVLQAEADHPTKHEGK